LERDRSRELPFTEFITSTVYAGVASAMFSYDSFIGVKIESYLRLSLTTPKTFMDIDKGESDKLYFTGSHGRRSKGTRPSKE